MGWEGMDSMLPILYIYFTTNTHIYKREGEKRINTLHAAFYNKKACVLGLASLKKHFGLMSEADKKNE